MLLIKNFCAKFNHRRTLRTDILLISVLIGILISFQINSPSVAGREISYVSRQLANQINSEKKEINHLKKELRHLEREKKDMELYHAGGSKEYRRLSEQVKYLQSIAGEKSVVGSGIIIRIDSGEEENIAALIDGKKTMLLLVNELRQNGAEFISINEQRLTNLSGITLAGNHLDINNNEIAPTYEIHVIGDSDRLYRYLEERSNTVVFMRKVYGFHVSIKQDETIFISAKKFERPIRYIFSND